MTERTNVRWVRRTLTGVAAPVAFLIALYVGLAMRSWSLDGCLMVRNADHFMDTYSYGHPLLRPAAFAVAALTRGPGGETPEAIYRALWIAFLAMGVAALTIVFNVARRRGAGLGAAWLALIIAALARDSIRHLTTLDEKALGLLGLAVAIAASDGLFRRIEQAPGGAFPWARLTLAGAAWVLAVFTHLQNAPFAICFVAALAFCARGPMGRRFGAALAVAAAATLAGAALFVGLHGRLGGWAALPDLLDKLAAGATATPRGDLAQQGRDAAQGWIKAWFTVDRLSPRYFLGLALGGWAAIMLGVAWGFMRRRDALGATLLGGGLLLAAVMPLANQFPSFGDSYTALIPAAMALMAAAPRALLAAAAAALAAVAIPSQVQVAFPPVTVQEQLARLADVREYRQGAPWVVLEELDAAGREQDFCPIVYPMRPDLRVESASFARLPEGRFLLETPLVASADGNLMTARLDEIQARLSASGRNVRVKCLYDGPRLIRTDWRAYGYYMIVEQEVQ